MQSSPYTFLLLVPNTALEVMKCSVYFHLGIIVILFSTQICKLLIVRISLVLSILHIVPSTQGYSLNIQ